MSLALNDPNSVSVGASGAIMGVLAGTFVVTFRDPEGYERLRARSALLRLLIPALVPRAAGQHIDVAGHMGGAIGGAVLATLIMFIWEKEASRPKFGRVAMAIPLLALLVLLVGLITGIASAAMLQGYSAERRGQLAIADDGISKKASHVGALTGLQVKAEGRSARRDFLLLRADHDACGSREPA
jgi:hypothetical protein